MAAACLEGVEKVLTHATMFEMKVKHDMKKKSK